MPVFLTFMMMALTLSADMTTIARGTLSGVDRARTAVVRTESEWHALWREHAPEQPAPTVDFSNCTVLAVFSGFRNTAGYSVTIIGVDKQGGQVIVRYRETRPAPGRMTVQIITAPFHIVSVPRVEGPISFVNADVQ